MSKINLDNYEAFLLDYSEGNLTAEESAQLKLFMVAHPELEIDLEEFGLPYLSEETEAFDFKSSLKKSEENVPDEMLLNYLEGNLSGKEKQNFELKLAADKDLLSDLELYRKTILKADSELVAGFKPELQKTEDDLILNNKVIAYFEKQLSAGEKIDFEKELGKNKTLQAELALVSKTLLIADKKIIHPDKASLKKENKVIVLFSFRNVASMAAAVLLLVGFAFVFNYINSKEVVPGQLAKSDNSEEEKNNSVAKNSLSDSSKHETVVNAVQNARGESMLANTMDLNKSKNTSKITNAVQDKEENLKSTIENKAQENPITKEEVTPLSPNKIIEEQKTELASNNKPKINEDSLNKQNYLVLEEMEADGDLINDKSTEKKGLWKRAVLLAKQANKLGVKSIDGQEDAQNKYRLSFNSFSVEKK